VLPAGRVIDQNEYDLLIETDVYGRMTQKEWARARGLAYATVRSWHHRAETAIERYERAGRTQGDRHLLCVP